MMINLSMRLLLYHLHMEKIFVETMIMIVLVLVAPFWDQHNMRDFLPMMQTVTVYLASPKEPTSAHSRLKKALQPQNLRHHRFWQH